MQVEEVAGAGVCHGGPYLPKIPVEPELVKSPVVLPVTVVGAAGKRLVEVAAALLNRPPLEAPAGAKELNNPAGAIGAAVVVPAPAPEAVPANRPVNPPPEKRLAPPPRLEP